MTPTDILNWATAHPGFLVTVFTALAGGGEAVRQYRKTGQVPLSTLPWRTFRRLAYLFRRKFYTVRRPKKPTYTLGGPLDAIRERLGRDSFEPGWALSYRYHGEDLNCRRYYLDPTAEFPHRQLHIRGFALEDGSVELMAHEEPAPKHHPKAHLKEVDIHDATDWVRDVWDRPSIDPRTFDRSQTDG